MKNFVQKLTYDDGSVKEIRRDYEEMLDFHNRLERNEIDGVRNFERKACSISASTVAVFTTIFTLMKPLLEWLASTVKEVANGKVES